MNFHSFFPCWNSQKARNSQCLYVAWTVSTFVSLANFFLIKFYLWRLGNLLIPLSADICSNCALRLLTLSLVVTGDFTSGLFDSFIVETVWRRPFENARGSILPWPAVPVVLCTIHSSVISMGILFLNLGLFRPRVPGRSARLLVEHMSCGE